MSEEKKIEYVVDETITGARAAGAEAADGLRYTESLGDNSRGTYRSCELWLPNEEKPVSSVKFYDFTQRFGGVAVKAEGLGDVNTNPDFRRQGYVTTVLNRALEGAAERVDVAFLFGISGLYGKFGFSSCLSHIDIDIWLKKIEHLEFPAALTRGAIEDKDASELIALFNEKNRLRPWTRVRDDNQAKRIFHGEPWRPRPGTIAIKEGGRLRGYGLIQGHGYGWGREPYKVLEAVADTPETANALLVAFRDEATKRGLDTVTVATPQDTMVGRALCHLGAKLSKTHNSDGGGMGAVLNRTALIEALEPELERRAGNTPCPGGALEALAAGELVEDPGTLIRLLTGYWSWADAAFENTSEPEEFSEILNAWFPCGGTEILPQPCSYAIDGY